MLRKFKMDCGHYAYSCNILDTCRIGGAGICDDCGNVAPTGYLVPVLNHYQCPSCFRDFEEHCKYYPEDLWFEERVMKYWESLIPSEKV